MRQSDPPILDSPVYAITVFHGYDHSKTPIVYMIRSDGQPLECLFTTDNDWTDEEARNHFWPTVITVARVQVTDDEYTRFEKMAQRAVSDTLSVMMEQDAQQMVENAFGKKS